MLQFPIIQDFINEGQNLNKDASGAVSGDVPKIDAVADTGLVYVSYLYPHMYHIF